MYTRKNLVLQNTVLFYTEFYSARRERVVFRDEAGSCIVGHIASCTTSPTREVQVWTRQYVCDRL